MKGMRFGEAITAMKNGELVRRAAWGIGIAWIRQIDLYNDEEFSVFEKAGSIGTWVPFHVGLTNENELLPYHPGADDIRAEDWELVV